MALWPVRHQVHVCPGVEMRVVSFSAPGKKNNDGRPMAQPFLLLGNVFQSFTGAVLETPYCFHPCPLASESSFPRCLC